MTVLAGVPKTARVARAALHAGMLLLPGRSAQARAVVEGTMDGLKWPTQPARIERYVRVAAIRSP